MANTPSFELEALKRDWIAGVSGETFYEQVCTRCDEIRQLLVAERYCGVLIAEVEPIEFAAIFFAALWLEVPIVLANPNWGQHERLELSQLVAPAMCFGMELVEQNAEIPGLPEGAVLVPTGGSTGGVKLAIHNLESLRAACAGVEDFLGGGPIDSCCVLPLYHVSGLMQLLRSFFSGGRIRFEETLLKGYCLSYVPTQLQRALNDSCRVEKLARAKAIFVGGGPLADSVAEQARELKLPVVPVYGMTETAAMVAAIPASDFLANSNRGARPMGHARIEIEIDKRIRIHSPSLFLGYQGRAPIDLADGYLTDDEGYIDNEGRLHIIGRMDRLIISGGEKIDPRDVEHALLKVLSVQEALVLGVRNEEWGQQVVAFCVLNQGQQLSGDWRVQLKQYLANYKMPKQLIVVETLPIDCRGKIDRAAIKHFL